MVAIGADLKSGHHMVTTGVEVDMIATEGFSLTESQPGQVTHRAAGSSAGTSSGNAFNFTQTDWQAGDYLFVAIDGEPNTPTITGGAGVWTLNTLVAANGSKNHVLHKRLVSADLTTLTVNVTNGGTPIGYRSYRGVMTVAYLQGVASAANAAALVFAPIIPNFLSSMLVANLEQPAGSPISAATNWGNGGARSSFGVFLELNTITYPSPGAPSFAVNTPAPSGQTGHLYELIGYPL